MWLDNESRAFFGPGFIGLCAGEKHFEATHHYVSQFSSGYTLIEDGKVEFCHDKSPYFGLMEWVLIFITLLYQKMVVFCLVASESTGP